MSCTESSLHTSNPYTLYLLPPEAQIQAWKEEIALRKNDMLLCIESPLGQFDFDALQDMHKIHTAKGIKAAVEQEIVWFGKEFNKPQMVEEHPTPSAVTDFQTMLYSSRYDEILTMSAMELANVCVNRWLSDDHILWLTENLNKSL